MTIKVKYETYRTDKPPIETIIEVPEDECAIMIETDYQRRLETAEDKKSVERREIQEIFTEDFNKPLYNNWHKANRHKEEFAKPFRKDDEDADETDGLDFLPDYSDEERRERKEDYDAVCQKLRMLLKSEYAEVLIAIVLDGKTPEDYADEIGVHRDAIYKRLQRAKKKCAKVFW